MLFSEVEALLSQEIKQQALAAITKAQRLVSDFIGFGQVIRGLLPRSKWEELQWPQNFSQVVVKVKVKAAIYRSGVALGQLSPW